MNLDNVFIEPKLSKLTKPFSVCIEMTGTGNRRALLADCWHSMTKPETGMVIPAKAGIPHAKRLH